MISGRIFSPKISSFAGWKVKIDDAGGGEGFELPVDSSGSYRHEAVSGRRYRIGAVIDDDDEKRRLLPGGAVTARAGETVTLSVRLDDK